MDKGKTVDETLHLMFDILHKIFPTITARKKCNELNKTSVVMKAGRAACIGNSVNEKF